jgi:hypothetical protein
MNYAEYTSVTRAAKHFLPQPIPREKLIAYGN